MADLTLEQVDYIQRASAAFSGLVVFGWQRAGRPPTTVTSFQRTPDHNRSVGGHPGSQHLVGTAIDLVPTPGAGHEDLLMELRRINLVVLDRGTHLHVQLFPASVRLVETYFPQLIV